MHGAFQEDIETPRRATSAGHGVRLSRMAGMLGRKPESLRKAPSAPGVQRPLTRIQRMIQVLRPIFLEEAGFRSWLRRRREVFGGESPLEILDQRKLQMMVEIAEGIGAGIHA